MGMKPSVGECSQAPIQEYIGTAYDVVKAVYDQLDHIVTAGPNADRAEQAAQEAVQALQELTVMYDDFDKRFLGTFTDYPTQDNKGNPLEIGALFYLVGHPTDMEGSYVYGSSGWVPVANTISSDAAAASAEAAAISETSAETSATQANNSATAAASSEQAAQTSETNAGQSATAASTSETNAAASATSASTSASNAALSETNAQNSETAAATSETNAAQSETNANSSATSAATSETNASASENLAQKWANEVEDVEVEPSLYSALHWATKAEGFASSIIKSVNPTADTVAQRTNDGRLKAAESTESDDVLVQSQAGGTNTGQLAQYTNAGLSNRGYGGAAPFIPGTGFNIDATNQDNGWHTIASGHSGTYPAGASTSAVLFVSKRSTGNIHQLYLEVGPNPKMFFRAWTTVEWTIWQPVYSPSTILGPVSQSSGVPTGAIIEHDSNSAGEYIKFADGTLICQIIVTRTSDITTPSNTFGFRSTTLPRADYPAAFSSAPLIAISSGAGVSATENEGSYSRNLGFIGILTSVNSQPEATFTFGVTAIGRWY